MAELLLAGYADADITPPLGTELTGYGYYLDRCAESVLDPLKVRAIALESGGVRLLLVACDLLGLTVADSDTLRRAIGAANDIPAEHILLACTHTHGGPASQQLRGIGTVGPAYMATVFAKIESVAAGALADLKPAQLSYSIEPVEPIGYNRRMPSRSPIDGLLKQLILTRAHDTIRLVSYACHPVAAGVISAVTADWPCRLISRLEATGRKAVFFQGFGGDINPNRRANALDDADETLESLGEQIFRAAEHVIGSARPSGSTALRAAELRVELPFDVPSEAQLAARHSQFIAANAAFENHRRFADEWLAEVSERLPDFRRTPYLANVPVQALALGDIAILALAGEVFCAYDHHFRTRCPALFTFGHANGNTGYFPTPDAFERAGDYEAHIAPMFYQLLDFSPRIESVLLRAAEQVLSAVAG